MLKAVAFDLWETLITDTPELSAMQESRRIDELRRILSESGLEFSRESVALAHRRLWGRCHDLYWRHERDIPGRQQIHHFLQELPLDGKRWQPALLDRLEEAYASSALEIPPALVPGALEVVTAIREKGLSVGLISNTGRTPGSVLRKILELHGFASSIDVMIFSNEHGECKPSRSIFTRLADELSVECAELMFVGDNLYADVHGARQCGMRAVHFDPPFKGGAVAPPVVCDFEIVPDAVVTQLGELIPLVESWLRD